MNNHFYFYDEREDFIFVLYDSLSFKRTVGAGRR